MKQEYEIYDEMTANAQEVADCIDDELPYSEEGAKVSTQNRKYITRTVLKICDNCEPKLTAEERKKIFDYVEASYGIRM